MSRNSKSRSLDYNPDDLIDIPFKGPKYPIVECSLRLHSIMTSIARQMFHLAMRGNVEEDILKKETPRYRSKASVRN